MAKGVTMKRIYTSVAAMLWLLFVLNGCGNTAPDLPQSLTVTDDDFIYEGHNFGPNRNDIYKQGVKDGCSTSDGDYRKDHTLFQTSLDYHDGWEHGRLHCKGKKEKER